MEPSVLLARARAEFESRLTSTSTIPWQNPTPCDAWTVRDLVAHVVGGDVMAATVLRGGSREDAKAVFASDQLGDDPVNAFVNGADALAAAFAEPGALQRTCHHPAMDMSGADLLGFRVGDYVLHGWDLARGLVVDDSLDPELVEVLWVNMSPMAAGLGATGMFGAGASGSVSADAPLQDRLLDLVGRRR